MDKRYERPLSFTERLWLSMDRAWPPYAIQIILEGTGSLDHRQLQQAVEAASQANPGSRLVLKGSLRGCAWIDSGVSPEVKIVSAETWDGYSGDNAPFLNDRVPFSGPTCEVVLVEGAVPRLIFRSNHAVMDAMGTLTWMEDIFRVLRGEKPMGSSSTLTDTQLVQLVSDKTKTMCPIESIAPTGKARLALSGVTWKRLSFSGHHTKLLGKVGLALARSAWKYGEGVCRIGIPVNIRPRLEGLRSTGNLTMNIYVVVSRNSTPESIVEDLHEQLQNKMECMLLEGGSYNDLIPLWLTGIGLQLLCKWQLLTGVYIQSAVLSTIGSIDTAMYSGGGFQTKTVFAVPPRMDGMPVFVIFAGTTDRLEITVSVPNALAGDGRLDQLLHDISAALQ